MLPLPLAARASSVSELLSGRRQRRKWGKKGREEGEKQGNREKERQTDRQSDRQKYRNTEIQAKIGIKKKEAGK